MKGYLGTTCLKKTAKGKGIEPPEKEELVLIIQGNCQKKRHTDEHMVNSTEISNAQG